MPTVRRTLGILLLGLAAHAGTLADERDTADKILMRPVVFDARGRAVGVLVPTLDSMGVYFRAGGRPVTVGLRLADTPEYKFTFKSAGYIVFSQPDCQGDVAITVSAVGAGFPAAVMARDQQLLLYVADSLKSSNMHYESFFQDGSCFEGSGAQMLYPSSAPPIDLAKKFSLPLRIR